MITLEKYQDDAAEWLSRQRRGLVKSPAGSGKTLMASAALDKVLRRKVRDKMVRVGWMANTREQVGQARKALREFPSINSMADVRIACAAAKTDWSDRDVLICDEVHHITADGWLAQAESCKGALWGLSATPDTGDTERYDKLRLIFDNNIYEVSRSAVKARLSDAKVIMLGDSDPNLRGLIESKITGTMGWRREWNRRMGIEMSEGELWAQVAWQACHKYGIVENKLRNRAVIDTAIKHKDEPTLILVNQVKHGEALARKMPWARLCYAAMGVKARREALSAFLAGTVKCIIATSLADEGLDLPNAQVLILVSGGRSKAKAEQRTGRVLRVFHDKPGALIYDFKDELQHPLLAKHSRVRQELYAKLGYEVYG